ncbi:MAG TPA: murein biosynthesis integral membrane protein MurJ [Alphaproteobacteria bacterium]|nr:murein biosynthesis integral membrane protein MurJ [Alphaproteobacteria bacterium]
MNFLKSSAIVAIGTLSSRILGFVRDLLIARFLGAGINSDILFIGLRIPNTFRQIFGEGAFNLAFVPLFKKYCDDKNINEKSLIFLEQTFSMFMLAIVAILIICEIFMPQILDILAPSLHTRGEDVYNLAVNVSRILMPYILFVSYMTFMGAVLNSLGKFAAMAFAPAMVNVGYIAAFIAYSLSNFEGNITYIPAIGMVFGGFLQFLVMYISIKRMPFIIKFVKPVLSPEVKLLFRKFVPTILGSGIVILNSLVSVFLASGLQKGSVSFLFYSDRMVQLPTALFGTAIATVLLPTLTQKLKENNDLSSAFMKVFGITLLISAFCTTFMYLNADLIINTLFERGAFDRDATLKTGASLALMALSIPAIMNLKIVSVIFYAQGNTKLPTFIAAASFSLNLVLCLILMQYFDYLGLVMAGVISIYFTIVVQLIIVLKERVLMASKVFKALVFYAITQSALILSIKIVGDLWNIGLDSAIIFKLLYLIAVGLIGAAITFMFVVLFKLYKKV